MIYIVRKQSFKAIVLIKKHMQSTLQNYFSFSGLKYLVIRFLFILR